MTSLFNHFFLWLKTERPKSTNQIGFSLLEMLIVLAIIGLLGTMVVPRYQAFTLKTEVDTAARELAQSIETSRIKAQSYGREVKLCPVSVAQLHTVLPTCDALTTSTSPWQAWVILELDNGAPVQTIARSNITSSNIKIFANNVNGKVINTMGQISGASSFSITVQAAQLQDISRTITFAPSGRVTWI